MLDGRLVKLFLFSTLLQKSPLTSIYFATFERGSQVSPTQTINFLVFGKYTMQYTHYLYMKELTTTQYCSVGNFNETLLWSTKSHHIKNGIFFLEKFSFVPIRDSIKTRLYGK